MKDQYFGDVNDYRKYGLLRMLLSQTGLSHTLCWMLTPSDDRSDGRLVDYLEDPKRWQHLDPPLFSFLQTTLHDRRLRAVAAIEQSPLLPHTTYYSPILSDDRTGRERYFADFRHLARSSDFVFFDPDNGLGVRSVAKGRKHSSKYLYWEELQSVYHTGHSVLVYQHFPRQERRIFTDRMARQCIEQTSAPWIGTFTTSNVLFLLLPQAGHAAGFTEAMEVIDKTWSREIAVGIIDA